MKAAGINCLIMLAGAALFALAILGAIGALEGKP